MSEIQLLGELQQLNTALSTWVVGWLSNHNTES